MRIALIVSIAVLAGIPGLEPRASDEFTVDLSVCQPTPRPSTEDPRKDAFLGILDAARCREGALRGALATPVTSEQRGNGQEPEVRLEVHAEASSAQDGPDAPQVHLSASAVDEGRAVEVRWDIQGEVTRCVAAGNHPLWSGIEAGPSVRSGSWIHYPADEEALAQSLRLRCTNASGDGYALLQLRLTVR